MVQQHRSPTEEMDVDPVGDRPKDSADARPPPRQACIECRRRVYHLIAYADVEN